MTHHVNTDWLNVRSEPRVINDNRLAQIPLGQSVKVLSQVNHRWSKIETRYNGSDLEGFVASRYLSLSAFVEPTPSNSNIVAVHRTENIPESTPDTRRYWSYPLGDPNRAVRNTTSSSTKVSTILGILDYLDVQNSERYRPATYTYCNIYAHDYAYLCGKYLPRVWWNSKALIDLAQGNTVVPKYADTIREMNANSLYDWLEDWGADFGWRRYYVVADVQALADSGHVCICVAKNKQTNRSGHLACVVPSHGQYSSQRIDGRVSPLMSQAGRTNKKLFNSRWWTQSRFNFFGFWVSE